VCIINPIDTKRDISMDWHPAQVKAALEMRGTNLSKLAKQHGYAHINEVLHRPWVAAEHIVARALGLAPEAIWPGRYQRPRDRGIALTRNPNGLARRGPVEKKSVEECPMAVAAVTGRASELSSATSEEECTVKKGFVESRGQARPAGGA
jgi:Ner family transcriptional regulator